MTTEVPVSAAGTARTIKAAPHCRLLFEPAGYHQRFVTLRDLRDAVDDAAVDIAGRLFPRRIQGPFGEFNRIGTGWEAWSKVNYLEAWRVFQSGQFIYYSSLEPVDPPDSLAHANELRLFDPAWFASALTHFALAFTEHADFSSGLRLEVSLHDVGGYALASHALFEIYRSESDIAHGQLALSQSQLAADPVECAATLLGDVLAAFRFEPSQAWLRDLLPRPVSASQLSA